MYEGTALVTNLDVNEINRAILDLLKKINESCERIDSLENALKISCMFLSKPELFEDSTGKPRVSISNHYQYENIPEKIRDISERVDILEKVGKIPCMFISRPSIFEKIIPSSHNEKRR